MKTLKLIPILTLVFLMGCESYNEGDIILVQQNSNAAPFTAKILYKTTTGYGVRICDETVINNHVEIPCDFIVRKVTEAKDTAEGKQDAKLQLEDEAKRKMLWCGFIPMVLLALSFARPEGLFASIPYMIVACFMWNPFVFFSVLIVFTFLSMLAIFIFGYLLTLSPASPAALFIGSVVYLIFIFSMLF